MRGKHASKPIEAVVAEAEEWRPRGQGVGLVAQDTTFYGIDIYGKPRLDDLLLRLERVDGRAWIRLMYFYPMYITDELLDVIAGEPENPALHRHPLAAHRRRRAPPHPPGRPRATKLIALLDRLRLADSAVSPWTTLIAGFPGETDEQFGRLAESVRRRKFELPGALLL